MAQGFRRRGKGNAARYLANLDRTERELLLTVLGQTHDLLDPPARAVDDPDMFTAMTASLATLGDADCGPPSAGVADKPDPALRRLLPEAHRDDPAAAAEFRRLTESGLRRRKADAIDVARGALRGPDPRIELDRATATSFLMALTDVRLVLGSRLGLRDDADLDRLERVVSGVPDDHPAVQLLAVYDFLTWLQETLAHALLNAGR